MKAFLALSACTLVLLRAQVRPPEIRPGFENLDFAQGTPGAMPPGWNLGGPSPPYLAHIAAGPECHASSQCGTINTITPSGALAFLYQIVDAAAYRGQVLTFRASVRAEVSTGNVARLLVRIHRLDGSTSFRDDMGANPIRSAQWNSYQLRAPIDASARDIEFGMQLMGHGQAWIDQISIHFENPLAWVK